MNPKFLILNSLSLLILYLTTIILLVWIRTSHCIDVFPKCLAIFSDGIFNRTMDSPSPLLTCTAPVLAVIPHFHDDSHQATCVLKVSHQPSAPGREMFTLLHKALPLPLSLLTNTNFVLLTTLCSCRLPDGVYLIPCMSAV